MHVFLIVNQASLIITKMIIDYFSIDKNSYKLISLRSTDTSIISSDCIALKNSQVNRILIKFFNLHPISNSLLKKIHKEKRRFILYSSWCYHESLSTPSIEKMLASNLCIGHAYIEEGQASYRYSDPFSTSEKKKEVSSFAETFKYLYREDSLAYIGIDKDVFPGAPKDKKIILENFSDIKNSYTPLLLGHKRIGLTCAERRLKRGEWKSMLMRLFKHMPNGGVVKLHPSFINDKDKKNEIISLFKDCSPENIILSDDKAIIEIEMLYEPKILIGALTSLSKYAEIFGSEFIRIDLY